MVPECATRPGQVLSDERFRAVAAGETATCGITRFGRPFCWGDNWLGQIGAYPDMSADRPTPVPGARTYLTIRVSGTGVCAQASDGRLDCWGGGRRIPAAIAGP